MIDIAFDTDFPMCVRKAFIRYVSGVYFTNSFDVDMIMMDKFSDQLIYILRDDGKFLIEFLKNFIREIKDLIKFNGIKLRIIPLA